MKTKKATKREFHLHYRPKDFSDIVGQEEAVQTLSAALKADELEHAILFSGPSGCGKTTLARILAIHLKCNMRMDYKELNAASYRGIDMVRQVDKDIRLEPIGGARVWVIDEAHQLTGQAQNAILKILEEPPDTSYVFLCTTDPTKLLRTIKTRCAEVKVRNLTHDELEQLLTKVWTEEGLEPELDEDVIDQIIEVSEGSARKALVLLQQICRCKTTAEMLDVIQKAEATKQSIDLARQLFRNARWNEVASILKNLEDDPELARRIIIKFASTIALGGGKQSARADAVYDCFRDIFISGFPDLVFACRAVCKG